MPVTAVARNSVTEEVTIVGDTDCGERHRAVVRKFVGVKQFHGITIETVLVVQDALVLQTVVAVEEIAITLLPRRTFLRVVENLQQMLFHLLAIRNLRQELVGNLVLSLHPVGRLLRIIIFKPAIRIRHRRSKILVYGVALFSLRILHRIDFRFLGIARCQHKNGTESNNTDVVVHIVKI